MSPIKKSLTVLTLTILVRMGTSVSLLERLLETTLRTASCQARCDGLSMEDLQDCLEICDLVTRNPRSSICEFPRFCTGGCRAACNTGEEEEERASLTSLIQQDCEVSWEVQSSHKAVSVVVGQDRTGMYSLVSGMEQGTTLRISPALSTKYLQLTVLTVDRKGLSDRKSLALHSVTECHPTAQPSSDHQVRVQKLEILSYESHSVLIGVSSLVTVLIIVFIVLAFIYRTRRGKTIPGEDSTCHNDKAFLLSSEDFLYDDQHTTEIYTFF